jgi:hypothetical protein
VRNDDGKPVRGNHRRHRDGALDFRGRKEERDHLNSACTYRFEVLQIPGQIDNLRLKAPSATLGVRRYR